MILLEINLFSQITVSKEDATCDLAADGSASVSITGGTPPYTITWSNGSTGPTVSKLKPGHYSVWVIDASGCSGTRDFEIKAKNSLKLTIGGANQQITFCANQGPPKITLTAVASGGTPPYNYSWPGASITISATGTYTCVVTDKNLCTASASIYVVFIPVQCAIDPNEILGLTGWGERQWLSVNDKISYTVLYENDPDFATAPAQEVRIRVPFDNTLEPASLRIGDFGFGDFVFNVPPNSAFYSQRLDVVDSLGIYVDVIAGLDVVNHEAFWIFQSIDPSTGLPPNDPQTGFLPVNDSLTHQGEGFVTFTVKPKFSDITGDSITTYAEIKFDINEPINTNVWANSIDAFPPVSSVEPLPSVINNTTFNITFNGSDDPGGTGIKNFLLYYSKDQGKYNLMGEFEPGKSALFTGQENSVYSFFSIAVDQTGNTEPMKVTPDVTTNTGNSGALANIRILMEGPFVPSSGLMETGLNTRGLIPADQPFNTVPWNYTGTETATSIPPDVVDWLLLELRDAPSPETATASTKLPGWPKAMFLKNDGSVVDLTGHTPNIGSINITHNLYVVVRHRNHIAVMSSGGMALTGNEYAYDFTTAIDKAFGGEAGYKQIGVTPPQFGMVAADIDADGSVFMSDFNMWGIDFGVSNSYFRSDCDLDGNVFVSDFNLWGINFGLINPGDGPEAKARYRSVVPE
jgi:hypothetical protein